MLNNRFQDIIHAEEPVLIDFYADWCGPCKMMPPVLKQLKDKMGDGIRIFKVNVDQHGEIASQYQVSSIPTLMLFRKGTLQWREPGVKNAVQLEQIIRQFNP
jgi:thioredoxin 1